MLSFPFSLKDRSWPWERMLSRILALESWSQQLSLADLRATMSSLRHEVAAGASLQKVAPRVFALVRETSRRLLGLRHYREQLLAGLALAAGNVVEMAAGEGKTLVALLPASLHALRGAGVHVATVNTYLAQRDFETMGPVYRALGFTIGHLQEQADPAAKRHAYQGDITYGVGYAFGFDYLRDQLLLLQRRPYAPGQRFLAALAGHSLKGPRGVQRGHAFVLIDEVDSVLIDEARSPLIISGAQSELCPHPEIYQAAEALAASLRAGIDFRCFPDQQRFEWTGPGYRRVLAQLAHLPTQGRQRPALQYVQQALRARLFFHKNVHYLINDEQQVVIVDEFTGRPFAQRSWSEGLHQAVQAKEGVPITAEHTSLARITRQRYFKLYACLAGMTGTAAGSEREFREIYARAVIRIPLHKPSQRILLPTRMFNSWRAKWPAVVAEIEQLHQQGRPVLVGTRTIAQSEECARHLKRQGLTYRLLNAKQDQLEAQIIAQAGQAGAITIATNMAGRGAHIPLSPAARQLGGLHVIAVERHSARRIDDQLIGRCARQGEPGSARFFVSAEDFLLVQHAPRRARRLQRRGNRQGELPGHYARIFDRLQRRLEKQHLAARKKLLQYDNWLDEVKTEL